MRTTKIEYAILYKAIDIGDYKDVEIACEFSWWYDDKDNLYVDPEHLWLHSGNYTLTERAYLEQLLSRYTVWKYISREEFEECINNL